jgi:hypothetical protein
MMCLFYLQYHNVKYVQFTFKINLCNYRDVIFYITLCDFCVLNIHIHICHLKIVSHLFEYLRY